MQFETVFEFNEQEFQLKIFNDNSFVYIQIICIDKALLWSTTVELTNLCKKFNLLEGCFFKPEDIAEYLIYQVSSQEFRLEGGDEENKVINLIFWVQKECEDEIEQYEFYFSLLEEQIEIVKTEEAVPKEKEQEETVELKVDVSESIYFNLFLFKI